METEMELQTEYTNFLYSLPLGDIEVLSWLKNKRWVTEVEINNIKLGGI